MNTAIVEAALAESRMLRGDGRPEAAVPVLERALASAPGHPRLLNMLGSIRLAAGDHDHAEADFVAAADADPAPPILLNLALARKGKGDIDGEREALDRALSADPYFQLALFHRGQWAMQHESPAAGAAVLSRFLATVPPGVELTPALATAVGEATAIVRAEAERLGTLINQAFSEPPSRRIAAAADIFSGRQPIYRSQPLNFYIPYLPEIPFFDRELFPWFTEFEAMAEVLTRELAAVIADDAGLEPYIAFDATLPLNQWRSLNNSRDWSALHLWRHGQPVKSNQARCPATTALLADLPLFDLAGRGPNVMFSILSPGAHIPPHTGSSNARATVHLPLVVPPGCAFRVGAETRGWEVGTAFAFDDTIEHEAWNRSDAPRAVMIVDAWNPYLSSADRAGVGTLTATIDGYSGRREWTG